MQYNMCPISFRAVYLAVDYIFFPKTDANSKTQ